MLLIKDYEEISQNLTKLYNDTLDDRNLESWSRERAEQDNHQLEEKVKQLKAEIQVLNEQLYGVKENETV